MLSSMPQWGKLAQLKRHVHAYSKSTTQRLRRSHWAEGLHWRIDHAGDVIYNLPLVADWLATGGGDAHQRAIEEYLTSLPSNQALPKKGTPKTTAAA